MIVSARKIGGAAIRTQSGSSSVGQASGGKSFQQILSAHEQPQKPLSSIPADPYRAMEQLTTRLVRNEQLSSRELLIYQLRAGQFGVQVELVSKVAESVGASLRKLQNQG